MRQARYLILLFICYYSVLQAQTNREIAHVLWLNQHTSVTCEVREQRTNSDQLPTRWLSFVDSHGTLTTAIRTPDNFVAMYPVADANGLFVTVWLGGSAYHVRVFNWKNNKPHCVLDDGSKMFPEVVFSITQAKKTFIFLNDYSGDINNPANWITKCYRWDDRRMTLLKKIPGRSRFQISELEK
jgi:hypothetical protein